MPKYYQTLKLASLAAALSICLLHTAAPVQAETDPTQDTAAPVQAEAAPAQDTSTPVQAEAAPAQDNAAPTVPASSLNAQQPAPSETAPSSADPNEDPRDREIRLLKEKLNKQQEQLDNMQRLLETLCQQKGQVPAGDPNDPSNGNGQNSGNADESEDPGPTPPSAEDEQILATPATSSEQQPSLNPNITLVVLGAGKAGGEEGAEHNNSFFLQEAELGISAPVDPNTFLEAHIGASPDEGVELEDAFATYSGWGHGLQAKGGLLKPELGRLNSTHTHALPQIDRPLPLNEYLGEEGLKTAGAELSWLTPLPWYCKIFASVGTRQGEHHHSDSGDGEDEELKALHKSSEAHSESNEEFELFPSGGSHNPLISARLENSFDLNDDTTMMVGISHASSHVNNGDINTSQVNGADITLKWAPTGDPDERSLVWQNEYLSAHQSYLDKDKPSRRLQGFYSYLSYRLSQHWRLGLRYDQADRANDPGQLRRVSAIAEYICNEWNTWRLQFNHAMPSEGKNWQELLLQWNLVIGPHGAHKY